MPSKFTSVGGVGGKMQIFLSPTVWYRYLVAAKGPTGYSSASTAEEVSKNWSGSGKVAIVTGAASGLGFETARVLALRGAEVIVTARDVKKATQAIDKLKEVLPASPKLVPMALDISSFKSVRDFASEFLATGKPLHILMNNAGIMANPFALSVDGHEMQMATNYFGPFLLTQLLMDKMAETAKTSKSQGRVVFTSSTALFLTYPAGILPESQMDSDKGYEIWQAYGQSKLAVVLYARLLAEKLKAKGIDVAPVSLHPGFIATGLARHSGMIDFVNRNITKYIIKNVPRGAATQVMLATADSVIPGEFYMDCNPSFTTPEAHDRDLAEKLWATSVKFTGAGANF